MKKMAALGLAALLAAGLSGCGGRAAGGNEFAPAENSIYIAEDGKVSSAFVEPYEEEYYTEDSLKSYLEEALAGQYGDLNVTLRECAVENGSMKAVFDYGSPEDLVGFLADQKSEDLNLADFQVETVETALAEGTVTADALVGAADGSPVDFETLARQKGYVVTVEGTASVCVQGEILYVSEGVEMTDGTARVDGGPAFLVIR